MTILWILLAVVVVWILYKIGVKALKWVVILILAVAVFWFFTAGGGVKIDKPAGMPDLPTFTK